jgi:benzoyl-CoA reductase/2-hydroxyglutaryl-CoA dehydratase subunit BcrC/BadD/HgdB
MRGDYDYLDGVIVPNTCDIIFSMQYFWKTLVTRSKEPSLISGMDIKPFVHYINYPEKVTGREVVTYYMEVLREFKQGMERDLSRGISDEDLRRAVAVYNQDKAQMKRMYEMRKQDPPLVSGYDAWTIANAGLMMPKDEHAAALKSYLDDLESQGTHAPGGTRIYLSGSAMDWVNAEVIKLVEESAVVVSDDLCVGTRSFWNPLDPSLAPLEAIARRSLGTACPRSTVMEPIPENRWAHIRDTIQGFDVDGVIFYVLKCCDGRLSEYPHLKDKLREELGLPVLYLEGDYTTEGVEQMRGRVEAFIEMIEG